MVLRKALRTQVARRLHTDKVGRAVKAVEIDPVEPGSLGTLNHCDLLKPEQLAARLQVASSWVYDQSRKRARMRGKDPLPFIRMGKYLRFYWPDVAVWLERHKAK